MSNQRATNLGWTFLLTAVLLGAGGTWPPPGAAQFPGVDEWAQAIAKGAGRHWIGQRVETPPQNPRPALPLARQSHLSPLSIHAPDDVPDARVDRVLLAAEAARDYLRLQGWGEAVADGGLGGTTDMDVYLVTGATLADGLPDLPAPHGGLDAVTSFAVVASEVPDRQLAPCVARAYAEAILLTVDPAEDPAWRHATGEWLAWMVTGRSCEPAVMEQQLEPWRSWIGNGSFDGAGGALLLALISRRYDQGRGTVIRDIWQLARQRTWEGEGLRGSPDLWEATRAVIEQGPEDERDHLEEVATELALDRFMASRESARGPLPPGGRTPIEVTAVQAADLPARLAPADPPLEPFGSAYTMVHVRDLPPGSQLRIWLRGELGVRWGLSATRLMVDGRAESLWAPPRNGGRNYLLVEVFEGTSEVLVVVTNLSSRLPDADLPDENTRSFRLVIDG